MRPSTLVSRPCVGAQCADQFFEHHASTYYGLLLPKP